MSQRVEVQFKRHPWSAAFPVMSDRALSELAASIQQYGQIEDILMFEGQIIDGWNRVLACQILGIEPRIRHLVEGESPLGIVLAHNVDHREMGKGSRALSIADLYYAVNGLRGRDPSPNDVERSSAAPQAWIEGVVWKQTKVQLANRAGCGERFMQNVLRIRQWGEVPVIDAVRAGDMAVEDALRILGMDIDGQYHAVKNHVEATIQKRAERIERQKSAAADRVAIKEQGANETVLRQSGVTASTDRNESQNSLNVDDKVAASSRRLLVTAEEYLDESCRRLVDKFVIEQCVEELTQLRKVCEQFLEQSRGLIVGAR